MKMCSTSFECWWCKKLSWWWCDRSCCWHKYRSAFWQILQRPFDFCEVLLWCAFKNHSATPCAVGVGMSEKIWLPAGWWTNSKIFESVEPYLWDGNCTLPKNWTIIVYTFTMGPRIRYIAMAQVNIMCHPLLLLQVNKMSLLLQIRHCPCCFVHTACWNAPVIIAKTLMIHNVCYCISIAFMTNRMTSPETFRGKDSSVLSTRRSHHKGHRSIF